MIHNSPYWATRVCSGPGPGRGRFPLHYLPPVEGELKNIQKEEEILYEKNTRQDEKQGSKKKRDDTDHRR